MALPLFSSFPSLCNRSPHYSHKMMTQLDAMKAIKHNILSFFPPLRLMYNHIGPCPNKWTHAIVIDTGFECPLAIGDAFIVVRYVLF